MSGLRAELSPKNEYWISKHRYYELKHFCLQYEGFKKAYLALREDPVLGIPSNLGTRVDISDVDDPVYRAYASMDRYRRKIEIIESSAMETDPVIGKYILLGVTTGMSYDILSTKEKIPCGRDAYYELYRKFFWILDRNRD